MKKVTKEDARAYQEENERKLQKAISEMQPMSYEEVLAQQKRNSRSLEEK